MQTESNTSTYPVLTPDPARLVGKAEVKRGSVTSTADRDRLLMTRSTFTPKQRHGNLCVITLDRVEN
jgi:hypothetical protein